MIERKEKRERSIKWYIFSLQQTSNSGTVLVQQVGLLISPNVFPQPLSPTVPSPTTMLPKTEEPSRVPVLLDLPSIDAFSETTLLFLEVVLFLLQVKLFVWAILYLILTVLRLVELSTEVILVMLTVFLYLFSFFYLLSLPASVVFVFDL